jgi:predicted nicotinamide N-methyase
MHLLPSWFILILMTTFRINAFQLRCTCAGGLRQQQTSNPSVCAQTSTGSSKRKKPSGRKGRTKDPFFEQGDEEIVPPITLRPTKTKTIALSFPKRTISIVQVDDYSWWEKADNPYGGKLWPSALGIANYLLESDAIGASTRVLELGCGTGLPSLVAASLGASVVATDISTVVLQLLQAGWKGCHPRKGSLSSQLFDVKNAITPLPQADIVIASAVLYDADLAKALAHRVIEACQSGAWVILGDDVTGERDGGRSAFLRHTLEAGIRSMSTDMTVVNSALGWQAKDVKLIHFNAPEEAMLTLFTRCA